MLDEATASADPGKCATVTPDKWRSRTRSAAIRGFLLWKLLIAR